MRNTWIAGLGVLAVTVGVGSAVALGPGAGPAGAAQALPRFDDCQQLRDWYVRAALPHVGPWGLDDGRRVPLSARRAGVAHSEDSATGRADPDLASGPVGNGETGTNLQEHGVDEPDLAKTNGTIAVVVDNGELVVSDVTGDEARVLSRVDTRARTADELLLVGDRAVLLGRDAPVIQPGVAQPGVAQPDVAQPDVAQPGAAQPDDAQPDDARPDEVSPGAEPGVVGRGRGIVPGEFDRRTVVTTVDLSDPAAPEIVDTRSVSGSYVTAREHDGTVRVVVGTQPRLPFVHPRSGLPPDEAEAKNRHIVRASTAEDWLPSTRDSDGTERPLLKCSDVRRPREASGLGMTAIVTLEPDEPARPQADAVVADGSLVYASADRLYVATMADRRWEWSARDSVHPPSSPRTQVHAFDTGGEDTSYLASGSVEGTVPDRWAMSEYDGRLRVASMRGDAWKPTETTVSVLQQAGDRLEVVGSVGGMGEDEQIRAVRWFGDTAVLVTFRQTDPLYTLDLSNPTKPRVAGRLTLPGYSGYLHPVGGDLLLGVGQDATDSGRQTGALVSSFDVSDLSDPTRLGRLTLGEHGYTPVEQDSRAFTYLPKQRLAFVPVLAASGTTPHVAVVRVGPDGALTRIKSLAAAGPLQGLRVLPVGGGRVAVVADGAVKQIVAPSSW